MCSAPGVGFSQGLAPLAPKPGCGAPEHRTGAFWVPTDAPRWVRGPRRAPPEGVPYTAHGWRCAALARHFESHKSASPRGCRMSCRRNASAPSPSSATADVGDRELSAAAQTRVEKKASKPAARASAPAFPVVLFSGIFLFFLAALYLTIKYS